jgi:glycosidase
MFNQLLDNILQEHPLLGLEKEDQNKGHITGLKTPDWVSQGTIYETFVRNFTPEGTFAGIRDKIPYLKDLGITIIWLMPVHPIGKKDRKGSVGSPYSIRDYSSIDPVYGTADDFKSLIRTAHENGMRVILDMVANHMAMDNVWRIEHPELFLKDDAGSFTRRIDDWSDVIDLDYSNTDVQDRMHQMICSWVREFDLDGFRCDVAGLVPLEFWETLHDDLNKIKDDIFLLAEWESAGLHEKAFHASYDWSTHFVLSDIYQGRRSAAEAITWVTEKEANFPRNSLPMRFTENHDLERTRIKFGEDSFYPFVVFNFLMYGVPMIYCGQEFGLKESPPLFEKDPINWELFDQSIFDFYKKLINLKSGYPAFSSRELNPVGNDKPDHVVSFEKDVGDQKILAILNFSRKKVTCKLDLSDDYHSQKEFKDIYSGNTVSYADLERLVLKPYGFYLVNFKN